MNFKEYLEKYTSRTFPGIISGLFKNNSKKVHIKQGELIGILFNEIDIPTYLKITGFVKIETKDKIIYTKQTIFINKKNNNVIGIDEFKENYTGDYKSFHLEKEIILSSRSVIVDKIINQDEYEKFLKYKALLLL